MLRLLVICQHGECKEPSAPSTCERTPPSLSFDLLVGCIGCCVVGVHLDPLLALFFLLHLATLLSAWIGRDRRVPWGLYSIPWIVCTSDVVDIPSLIPSFLWYMACRQQQFLLHVLDCRRRAMNTICLVPLDRLMDASHIARIRTCILVRFLRADVYRIPCQIPSCCEQ